MGFARDSCPVVLVGSGSAVAVRQGREAAGLVPQLAGLVAGAAAAARLVGLATAPPATRRQPRAKTS